MRETEPANPRRIELIAARRRGACMSPRVFSGLHWTMPNGTMAPGKVFPPFDEPMSGLTKEAGSFAVADWAAQGGVTDAAATSASVHARYERGMRQRYTTHRA